MPITEQDLAWLDDRVDSVPYGNWMYKVCCLLLFVPKKKMTYRELFLLFYGLNKRKVGHEEAELFAYRRIVEIYKHLNNNQLPNTHE